MKPASDQSTSRQLIASLRVAIQTFQSRRPDTPINMVVLFLLIAERGKGIGAAELAKLAGVSHASVSRNVQALGYGKKGELGLDLVRKTIDPLNPRAHVILLTKEGQTLAGQIAAELAVALGIERPQSGDSQLEPMVAASGDPEPFSGAHWEVWMY